MAADGKKTRNKKTVKTDRNRSGNTSNKNLELGAAIVLIIIVAAAVVFSDRGTSGTSRHNTTSQLHLIMQLCLCLYRRKSYLVNVKLKYSH